MMQELFDKNVFVYIMLGLGMAGVLLKLLLHFSYFRLVKATETMGTSKNKLIQLVKLKFESYYKLKIGVNNVDIFVDKYVYRNKFGGLFLSTWENICGQALVLCLLIGSSSSILGLIYECGKQQILSTFSVGILISGLLILFDGIINIPSKKERIRINMKEYLENIYKVRLEHPELFQQYKSEQGENEISEPVLKRTAKAVTRLEKANMKKAAKEKKLQEKKDAKLRKKEEAVMRKQFMLETKERLKLEEKLAIERKREEDRRELQRRKAEALAKEQQKREERIRQEEIKKALLLEKQISKEEKQNKPGDHLTIAQARKESLKREIQDRREMVQTVKEDSIEELREGQGVGRREGQGEEYRDGYRVENKEVHRVENKEVHRGERQEDVIGKSKNKDIIYVTPLEEKKVSNKIPVEVSREVRSERSKSAGNATGNVLSNATANETASILSNATASVTGNVLSNASANATGNTLGNVSDNPSVNTSSSSNTSRGFARRSQKSKQQDFLEEKIIADTLKEFLA